MHVENHPLRLVAGLAEASTTRRRLAYFSFFCCELSVFIFSRISIAERFDVDLLQQFLDALGAHHGDEAGRGYSWSSSRLALRR